MNAFEKFVIILDIDGTLYDKFSQDDRYIISSIFKGCRLVKIIDRFFWMFNSLDFVTNQMHMLKLRLKIYSILSFSSFEKVEKDYEYWYQQLLVINLENKKEYLKKISEIYDIVFVTSNIYASSILSEFSQYNVIYSSDVANRRKQIKAISENKTISYVIGNNYIDDIYLAKKIDVISIYIGESILKKVFKADFNVTAFINILEILENGS